MNGDGIIDISDVILELNSVKSDNPKMCSGYQLVMAWEISSDVILNTADGIGTG